MAKITLKRELGLFHATAYGVGLILGAGIYVLIGEAANITGNSIWLAFLFSAIVALLTGFSYAELSSMFPKNAAEYSYTERSFGKPIAFFIGYSVILSTVIAAATVATGFAGYFCGLINFDNLVLIAILVLIVFSILNYISIKGSSWTNIVFTAIEIIGLLIIIGLALYNQSSVNILEMPEGFGGVMKASALVFFAFLGFEAVVRLSEECREPRKTIPKAVLFSIIISTLLYIAVAISAVSILNWEVLGQSTAPLADVAASILGNNAFIVLSLIALFSTGNTVLISLVAGSRGLYGISEEYKLLKPFNKVHKRFRTPHIAVCTVMIFSIFFTFLEDIGLIAELTNFMLFITFAIINLVVIVLRYKDPLEKRGFRIPLRIGKFPVLPFLGFLTCIYFLVNLNFEIILGGLGLMTTGILLYLVVIYFEKRLAKA